MNAAVERRCGVKIGVLQFFSWPERRVELSQVYARALQRIEIMDRTGYDAVWLAEHHFSSFSVCPSVHMMGVLAAARTTRLRIGTGVSLAPFYHPLRLAEEVALLDQVSGGRVNWGAGRELPIARLVALGDTAAEGRETARAGAQWIVDSYFGAQHNPVGIADPNAPGVDRVQRYLDEVIMHGTVDSVLDQIAKLREEIGLDYLLAAPLSHKTFGLLTEKILPRLP